MAHPTITESTKSSNVYSKVMKSISFHNYGMNSYSNLLATTIATAAQQTQQKLEEKRRDTLARDKG